VGGERQVDAADRGHAEGQRALLHGGGDATAGAGQMGRHVGEHDAEDRAHEQALAQPDEEHAGHQSPAARMRPRCAEPRRQDQHAHGVDQSAGHHDAAAEAGQQAGRHQRRPEEGQGERQQDHSGAQGAQAGAVLERERVDEHEAAEGGEEGQPDQEAPAHAGRRQQRGRDQRHAAGRLDRPFGADEGESAQRAEHQQGDGPPGPAERAALGQRDQEAQERCAEQQRAPGVDGGRVGRARVGDDTAGHQQPDDPDRHVDQEDRAPLRPGDVGRDQQPAQQLAGRAGDAAGGSVQTQRPVAGVAGGGGLDRGEDLREHQGCGRSLEGAERDEEIDVRRQAAREGGQREGRHPCEEQPSSSEGVAQAAPDNEEDGVGDGVAGHHQLEHAGRGLEVPVDGRERDVDDEEVGDREEHADEDGDEAEGGQRRRRRGRGRGRVVQQCHPTSMGVLGTWYQMPGYPGTDGNW
jgi:hypothetical protein